MAIESNGILIGALGQTALSFRTTIKEEGSSLTSKAINRIA